MIKMKNSGIEWIGEIPDDWNLIKIGSIFQCRNEKVNDTDYPPLSVSKGGIVPQMNSVAKTDANDNRKLVLENDFVINSRSDRKQSCGYSTLKGSVSLINIVLYTTNNKIILPQYTDYLMKNYGFAEEFYRWGHGIVADLWTTRWQEMKSIVLPIPSVDIQQIIADHLDEKCAAVDRLIENQQAQIEKLKEYKQSVITEAVTRGLDPSSPMKDSGFEWLGEIPNNWDITSMKFLCSMQAGKNLVSEQIAERGEYPVYGGNGLRGYYEEFNHSGECLLIGRQGALCGNVHYVDYPIWATEHAVVTECKKNISCRYFYYLLKGINLNRYVSNAAAQPGLAVKDLINIRTCICDSSTQQQIADYLDKKCAEIDKLISIKQQKIETLTEYKKSLIYEYVTGKKQVG